LKYFSFIPYPEKLNKFHINQIEKMKRKKNRGTTRIPQNDQNKRKNAHEEKRHSPVATK
jgi:hypothetical protein